MKYTPSQRGLMNPTIFDYFLAICSLYIKTVSTLRELYFDICFLTAIGTLWQISCNFKSSMTQACLGRGRFSCEARKQAIYLYKKISELCRIFNEAYGLPLLTVMICYQIFYAKSLTKMFDGGLVEKIARVKFLLVFSAYFGLGIQFSRNVLKHVRIKTNRLKLIRTFELT